MKKVRPMLGLLLLFTSYLSFADNLKTDGGTIYFEKIGDGPAIILLHGGFGDLRMWDDQMQPFARNHQVIRYDQPGFGKSSAPDKTYSPVAVLTQLMDHLAIQKAVLVGNSMGGT